MSERRAPSKLRDRPTASSLSFAGSQIAGIIAEPRAIASGCRHSTRPLNVGTAGTVETRDRSTATSLSFAGSQIAGIIAEPRAIASGCRHSTRPLMSERRAPSKLVIADGYLIVVRRFSDRGHYCRTASDSERMLHSTHLPCRTASDSERMPPLNLTIKPLK